MTNTKNSSVEPIFDDAFKGDIDPFALFETWMTLAGETEPNDPNAMALATLDADGMPDVRMVLLNGRDERGFVFYTNLDSDKARELRANQRAALLFHWKSQRRQVRIRGDVELVTDAEADTYFATRPRGSQIGAHASEQSRPLVSRDELVARTEQVEKKLGDGDIPRPKNWSGFRVKPRQIEFWKDGAFRLHDRVRFTRAPSDAGWARARLNP